MRATRRSRRVGTVVEIRLRGCKVLVWPERRYLETRFPDGCKVPAAPNFDEASRALALEIGYGDGPDATWNMSRFEHEILHTVVAEHLGQPFSAALWLTAHGAVGRRGVISGEEGRVLALQAFLNLGTRSPALDELPDLDTLVAVARATLEPLESLHAT
jgi:hypothetical protein